MTRCSPSCRCGIRRRPASTLGDVSSGREDLFATSKRQAPRMKLVTDRPLRFRRSVCLQANRVRSRSRSARALRSHRAARVQPSTSRQGPSRRVGRISAIVPVRPPRKPRPCPVARALDLELPAPRIGQALRQPSRWLQEERRVQEQRGIQGTPEIRERLGIRERPGIQELPTGVTAARFGGPPPGRFPHSGRQWPAMPTACAHPRSSGQAACTVQRYRAISGIRSLRGN